MRTFQINMRSCVFFVLAVAAPFAASIAGAQPANDQCSNPTSLTVGQTFTMSTTTATNTNDPASLSMAGCTGIPVNVGKGVWFRLVVPTTGVGTVSTCGSDF